MTAARPAQQDAAGDAASRACDVARDDVSSEDDIASSAPVDNMAGQEKHGQTQSEAGKKMNKKQKKKKKKKSLKRNRTEHS